MSILLLFPLAIIVCLVLYGVMGFIKNVGSNDPKDKALYRWIFFYTLVAIAAIVAVVKTNSSTIQINTIVILLLSVSYFLVLRSSFRFQAGKIDLPVIVHFVFGTGLLFFMIYPLLEILQSYGFYRRIGNEPIIFALIIQLIFRLIIFVRVTRK